MATLTLTPKGFRVSLPSGLPDLIVQSVTLSPASPNSGDHVVFSAVVKNQGTGPTPDTGIGILFSIDGSPVSWATDTTGALAAGSTRTLTATNGTSGGAFWAAVSGNHTLLVNVNDALTISESVTVNDTLSQILVVGGPVGAGTNYLASPSTYGYPDATNTGSDPKDTLTVHSGNITLGAGDTLTNTYLQGRLILSGSSGTPPAVSNVYIESSGSSPIVDYSGWTGANATFTDCTIISTGGAPAQLLKGNAATFTRCDVSGFCQDIMDNVSGTFDSCFLHDPNRSQDPTAHSDVTQVFIHGSAASLTYQHCTMYPNRGNTVDLGNSVFQFGAQTGDVNCAILIDDCLLGGGNYTINANFTQTKPNSANGKSYNFNGSITVRNCRFARKGGQWYAPRYGPIASYSSSSHTGIRNAPFNVTFTGNVYDDDGTPV